MYPVPGVVTVTAVTAPPDTTTVAKPLDPSPLIGTPVAGKGVSHTERTPENLRKGTVFTSHGYQIWVALPKELEDCEPEFHHFDAKELPSWTDGVATFTLVAGKGYGKESPVPVYSELFMVEIKNKASYNLNTKDHLKGEIGICIVAGGIEACGENVGKGNIVVAKVEDTCKTVLQPNSHIILFGGIPFPEERHIYWNFVSSSKEKIEKAKAEWAAKTFPLMKNDNSYIALPK